MNTYYNMNNDEFKSVMGMIGDDIMAGSPATFGVQCDHAFTSSHEIIDFEYDANNNRVTITNDAGFASVCVDALAPCAVTCSTGELCVDFRGSGLICSILIEGSDELIHSVENNIIRVDKCA